MSIPLKVLAKAELRDREGKIVNPDIQVIGERQSAAEMMSYPKVYIQDGIKYYYVGAQNEILIYRSE